MIIVIHLKLDRFYYIWGMNCLKAILNKKKMRLFLVNRLKTDLKTTFVSKILFLKHYGQVLFINFRAEAAQLPTLVRPINISK